MLREIIVKARDVIASHKSRLSEIDSLLARNPKTPSVRSMLQRERETKVEETRTLESLVAEAEELEGVRSLRVLGMISRLEKTYAYEWLKLERLIERDRPHDLPAVRVPSITRTPPPLIYYEKPVARTGRKGKRKPSKLELKRRSIIFGAIQAQLKGLDYCRELDRKKLSVPPSWVEDGCPRTYVEAYKNGANWQKKIQDEKHRCKVKYDDHSPAQQEAIITRAPTRSTRS